MLRLGTRRAVAGDTPVQHPIRRRRDLQTIRFEQRSKLPTDSAQFHALVQPQIIEVIRVCVTVVDDGTLHLIPISH